MKIKNKYQYKHFNDDHQKWIEIIPVIGDVEIKRNIKISGKFEFNHFKDLIKVHQKSTLEGILKNDQSVLNRFNYLFNLYKNKKIFSNSSSFDIETKKYNILFIKNKKFWPSTLNFFTTAGSSDVQTIWKNKKTNSDINDMNWTKKEIENDFLHNDHQEWIEIVPVIGDVEIKRNIKISGKFEFNHFKNFIKVHQKSTLEGTLKDDQASLDRFNYLFDLYKDQKFFSDSSYFDNQTKKYKIFFIKDKYFKPSTLNFYTRAATNDDQTIWKNKKTNLFIDNFEPIKNKSKKKKKY